MGVSRRSLFWGVLGLLIALILGAGCSGPSRSVLPEVTSTPAGGGQDVVTEGPIDLEATARANSADATATAEAMSAADSSTEPPLPTATPTPIPTAVPTEAPIATATPSPTTQPSSGTVTHHVQAGENLFRIALRYGTSVEAIAQANGIANPSQIRVGQVLTIPGSGTQPAPAPGGDTYVVKAGDNLYRIGLRYNTNYLQLAQYNNISDPSRIYVGQIIRIPAQ